MKTNPQRARGALLLAGISIACGAVGLCLSYGLQPQHLRDVVSFPTYLANVVTGCRFAPVYRFAGEVECVGLASLVMGGMFGYLLARRLAAGPATFRKDPPLPAA